MTTTITVNVGGAYRALVAIGLDAPVIVAGGASQTFTLSAKETNLRITEEALEPARDHNQDVAEIKTDTIVQPNPTQQRETVVYHPKPESTGPVPGPTTAPLPSTAPAPSVPSKPNPDPLSKPVEKESESAPKPIQGARDSKHT